MVMSRLKGGSYAELHLLVLTVNLKADRDYVVSVF